MCTLCGAGFTDDVLEYLRVSVPKNMLADLKDSVKQGRSLNIQDKYGATAVSVMISYCGHMVYTVKGKPVLSHLFGCVDSVLSCLVKEVSFCAIVARVYSR